MKLITKELLEQFKKYGTQEDSKNQIAIAKFFNPTGAGTWYVISYDEKEEICFGYASIFGDHNDEYGYFSIKELEEFKGKFGLGIERDLHFEPTPMSEILKNK